jgi:hypothetical protein
VRPRLSVRARFERFPATLKGAFILRGEDSDPHQVVLGPARMVPVPGGQSRPIAIAESTLDVAPRQDVFVPFETGVSELEPGWYELECEIVVDGVPDVYPGGKRFSVPWPRASTRRGQVAVDADLRLKGVRFSFDRLECAADHVTLQLRSDPPTEARVGLTADGADLPILDVEWNDKTGALAVSAYPILKSQTRLRIGVTTGAGSGGVEVPLP